MCASGGDGFDAVKQLHEAWATKQGVKLPPEVKVTVNDVKGQDGKATVPDTDIKVGDKTLRDIELIESTGDTSSFQLSLQVQKKDDLWYVAGMDIKA
ncbi:hypothetical protein GKO32_17810 [Amycolatopsis sp. RM579]|uniref:Uncharacterized protein n=1 Tax=Amycolatopsis pithecellobii TaxID=664692 RepID=A0A6N7Z7D5_9PSEU|nr:hypothetical protein [Amycolatopsis pithecellobii]